MPRCFLLGMQRMSGERGQGFLDQLCLRLVVAVRFDREVHVSVNYPSLKTWACNSIKQH